MSALVLNTDQLQAAHQARVLSRTPAEAQRGSQASMVLLAHSAGQQLLYTQDRHQLQHLMQSCSCNPVLMTLHVVIGHRTGASEGSHRAAPCGTVPCPKPGIAAGKAIVSACVLSICFCTQAVTMAAKAVCRAWLNCRCWYNTAARDNATWKRPAVTQPQTSQQTASTWL